MRRASHTQPLMGTYAGTATSLPATLPTFSRAGGSTAGLNLLASAAQLVPPPTSVTGTPATLTPTLGLLFKGPYNPAAVLPPKVAKKILDLEFVEMSEISLDDSRSHTPGQPPQPARPPIQNISAWVEKFSVMAALLASRFPEKAPELFSYQASVVRAERNFDNRRWVAYDRCYRREALAQKNLDWSMPNARLYNEAFTGHARVVPRCSFCLQEDHVSQACPRNPNRPWFGWTISLPPDSPVPSHGIVSGVLPQCKLSPNTCRYSHCCTECGGPHPRLQCPRGGHRGNYARPRSPISQPRQPARQAQHPPGTTTTGHNSHLYAAPPAW